jgi:RNA polymerase sigma-70 factor (ECF subfamily)
VETAELKSAARRAARGEEDAAAALFDHFYPRLFAYALAKLRNRSDAEDVASETFVRVLRDLHKFRWKGGGFEAWIFRIASNLVVDHVRRAGREVTDEDAAEKAGLIDERDPEASVLKGELSRELNEMLERLAPDQREVLLLRFAGGLDAAEVGRVMQRKPNAVRQLQFRALENLREMKHRGVEAR